MTTPPRTQAPTICAPQDHHLTVYVHVRAIAVLTPDEQTFEFHGDNSPHLKIDGVNCTECGLYIHAGEPIPPGLQTLIEDALEDACIMEPLGTDWDR